MDKPKLRDGMGEIDVALPPRSFYAKIVPKIKIGSDSFSNSLTEILKLRDGSHGMFFVVLTGTMELSIFVSRFLKR